MFRVFTLMLLTLSIGLGVVWSQMSDTERLKFKLIMDKTYLSALLAIGIESEPHPSNASVTSPIKSDKLPGPSHMVAVSHECKSVPSRERKETEQIYRWVDKEGGLTFSNIKPLHAIDQVTITEISVADYFTPKIIRTQSAMSADNSRRIEAGMTLIYRMFSEVIGVRQSRHISLNMRFIDSREDFDRHRMQIAPNTSPATTGFFNTRTNESVIYSGMSERATERIALHEATHAIVAAMFGTTTPVWLNEGLASYMEEMEVQGQQSRRIGYSPERFKTIRTAPIPRLSRLLKYSRTEWYNENALNENYAFSWSIVRYLMSDRRYIKILGGMLNDLADTPCLKVDALAYIDKAYLGGSVAFERSWSLWLRSGKEGVQVF